MILREEDEFGAIQSDTISFHISCRNRISNLADIGAQPYLNAVLRDCRKVNQVLQGTLMNLEVGFQLIVFAEYFLFGVDEDSASQSIHDHQIVRTNLFRGFRNMHEHGDAKSPGEDRGVRCEAASFHNQPTNVVPFQLRHSGGEQLVRDKDASVWKVRDARSQILRQMVEEPL